MLKKSFFYLEQSLGKLPHTDHPTLCTPLALTLLFRKRSAFKYIYSLTFIFLSFPYLTTLPRIKNKQEISFFLSNYGIVV